MTLVLRVQAAQGLLRRVGTIRRRWRIALHVAPEVALQIDQSADELLVALDAMDLQVLATEQHGYVSRLLAGDRQLVHHLQLHVHRHTFLPETGAIDAGGLAFEDLYVAGADHLTVDVGQHPVQLGIRVLQHGIDPPHPVASAPGIVAGDDGLEDVAPVGRAFLVV